jgi:hypothetical protein
MSLEKLIAKSTACRFWYNLTGKPMYLNCLIEHNLNNERLNEAYRLITEEFIPKTLEKSVDQTEFAYTYFLYGEYLLKRGQISNAKDYMKKGFNFALSTKGKETPKMMRRLIEQKVYQQFKDNLDFQKFKEQVAIQSMGSFNTKTSMINYFSRGDPRKYESVATELGL